MKQEKILITESLFDNDVSGELYGLYADENIKFECCDASNAPYVIGNAVKASGCRLLSVTLPIYKTLDADENGDFVFTLLVYGLGLSELKKEAKRVYAVKINAERYSLGENTSERKIIRVDLTSYDIVLAKNESLGFFAPTDTICPAIVKSQIDNSNEALRLIREKAVTLTGAFVKAGSEELAYSHDTLIVDFELEREYDSEEQYLNIKNKFEYKKMVGELAPKYKGKYLSVFGDSISSYVGICNDTKANVTIGENAPYYPTYSPNVYMPSLTYWGKVAHDLDMKICVDNAWSGSSAYGRDFGKNMLIRCADLHRDGGTPDDPTDDILPDVILIYMSANDINGGSPLDAELLDIIADGADISKIDAWLEGVLEVANRVGGAEKGKTYANFAQVYALSMNSIKQRYPNAELYCLTLEETNHPNTLKRLPERYDNFNKTITALAEYFGAGVADLSEDEITFENCHAYAGDMHSLHPTAAGHEVMCEAVIKAMYKNIK